MITAAASHNILAMLAADMSDSEQEAVWILIKYLANKERGIDATALQTRHSGATAQQATKQERR